VPFREIAYRGKQLVLRVSMASELNVLAHRLNRFSERSRYYRDFTLNSLNQAMREIIACFPVYRSYVNERETEITERDRGYIQQALREAKRRNPNRPAAVYNFIADLLTRRADYLSEAEHDAHMNFIGKFQQLTSPVTAKGIEDTALYNYHRLVSLNEVGGEPDHFGIAPERLHAWLSERARRYPHALSATSTHDTKRSEDVRARLNVLSAIPAVWKQAATRWARANRKARFVIAGERCPSRNEEYLLYQTLVGSWPLEPMTAEQESAYGDRIVAYMQKAMREAKVHTSWINPSEEYEACMTRFVRAVLAPSNRTFREAFLPFQQLVATFGLHNSLAQLAVKAAAPGVPDFYQGTELWDFSLVDPDNRRSVDYQRRQTLLAELDAWLARQDRAAVAASLMEHPADDRCKLYATALLLRLRRDRHVLFAAGSYEPLQAEGAARDHVFAFLRRHEDRHVIVVVPRLIATLTPDGAAPLGEAVWGDTRLVVPDAAAAYTNLFTGTVAPVQHQAGRDTIRLADVLDRFSIGCLEPGESPAAAGQ
jgi:(1->4)-alpha-D-glucan 1-alpha-D-glucosylmutase